MVDRGTKAHAVQTVTSWLVWLSVALTPMVVRAQAPPTNDPAEYGPYNVILLPDGTGVRYSMAKTPNTAPEATPAAADTVLLASSQWTISAWYNASEAVAQHELLAGVGDITGEYPRYLSLEPGKVALWMGAGNEVSAPIGTLQPGTWHLLTATFDGARVRLYSDGVFQADAVLATGETNGVLQVGPWPIGEDTGKHFGGRIAAFTLMRRALSDAEVKAYHAAPPDFSLLQFEEASKPWPLQSRGQAGYRAPQDPQTLPKGRAPFSKPSPMKALAKGEALVASAPGEWTLSGGWQLREAPKVEASAQEIATPGFRSTDWLRAEVPGTVLQSMIEDGIYPDPDYGLNNLAIPESLNKQDYWYRNEFSAPKPTLGAAAQQGHVELTFQGINYKAEVWLNGTELGVMKGAFKRGVFDVTPLLKERNVLVVRVSPPPHPGIPQEQSILGGPGENGGSMELDGPTFLATEGWDWIPAIRDRNTGIWQPVTLKMTHVLTIGDTQVVSTFPHHDYTHGVLAIEVPLKNTSGTQVNAVLDVAAEGLSVRKQVAVSPGETTVKLTSAEFPQLNVDHPRLWWPNGYGKPELYHLAVKVSETAPAAGSSEVVSDQKSLQFGMREVSYELSLLDNTGHLRRMEYLPAEARGSAGPIVDVSHEGMREVAPADAIALNVPEARRFGYRYASHVSSIAPGMERSPALTPLTDQRTAPYLVLRVNGVRIAARGGNWGMDDSRKRVSREHLEPYFRLHRDANVNMIRNWVGQNTEETFYDLADEYGLMVWNDFWESTQNYNIEAEDPQLFLENAADTIKHFRTHPSIVVWCGRNEGVPQPILNKGLEELTRTLDGTRFYSPSSNQVNLQDSGPYRYQDPKLYYSSNNRGFSVETGTPSMSTLESFESTNPKEDWWPVDDVWAYHDWHQSGNGAVQPFMREMEEEFGAPTSLEDFERKAQMLNYVDHRAIFEGMNAHLWAPNSGRLLWMTQPAWPSTMWQILSADYDTQASFYGTKAACEPVHVQLNLDDGQVDVVNTTPQPRTSLTVRARVLSLDNTVLYDQTQDKDVSADDLAHAMKLDLPSLETNRVVLLVLSLTDAAGAELSHNVYWLSQKPNANRELTALPRVQLKVEAKGIKRGGEFVVRVVLTNPSQRVSLANKLTLVNAKTRSRILPAYYTDNYVSLLPGETRSVEIEYDRSATEQEPVVELRGWNAERQSVKAATSE